MHEAYPSGFVRLTKEGGHDDGGAVDVEVIELQMKRELQMRRARLKLRVALYFYQKLLDVRKRKQWVRYQVVESAAFQGIVS